MKAHLDDFVLGYRLDEPSSRPNESGVCADQEPPNVDQTKDELPISCVFSLDLLA
jgi:hypothetical protein